MLSSHDIFFLIYPFEALRRNNGKHKNSTPGPLPISWDLDTCTKFKFFVCEERLILLRAQTSGASLGGFLLF